MPNFSRNRLGKAVGSTSTLAPRSRRISGGYAIQANWLGVFSLPNIGVAMYFSNGDPGSTAIQKLDYPTETRTTLAAVWASGLGGKGGQSNSGTAGYVHGAYGWSDAIYKLLYSTEASSALAAIIYAGVGWTVGCSNDGTSGYLSSGQGFAGSFTNSITKLSYSADTVSVLSATLPTTGLQGGGCSNTKVAGYWHGGYNTSSSVYLSSIKKMLFSNDTVSTMSATLTVIGSVYTSAASFNTTCSYVVGQSASYSTATDIYTYATDTKTVCPATLATALNYQTVSSNLNTAVYIVGGNDGTVNNSLISKIVFATNTYSTISATTAAAHAQNYGFSNNGVL